MFDIGFPPTWSTLKKLIWLKVAALAQAVYETVTGAIASFTTVRAAPLRSLTVDIEPVQDLHGYDNPWPAGGGVNKLPPAASMSAVTNGELTVTPYADGHYHVKKTTSSNNPYVDIPLSASVNLTTDMFFTPLCSTASGNRNFSLLTVEGTNLIECYFGKASTQVSNSGTVTKLRIFTLAAVDGEWDVYPMLSASALASGTNTSLYSPYSNICPISEWTEAKVTRTGKNLFEMTLADIKAANTLGTWTGDKYVSYDLEFTFEQENGFVTAIIANGTPTEQANLFLRSTTLPLIKGTSYKLNGCPSGGSVDSYGLWANASGITDYGSGVTFTANVTTVYNGRIRIVQGTVCNDLTFRPMIRLSADDAAFAPYSGTSLTIDLDGTRYGGTLDVLTGVLTVDKVKHVFTGSESWSFLSNFFYCALLTAGTFVSGDYVTENGVKMYLNANNGQARIYLAQNSFLDSSSNINSYLTNQIGFVLDLATPQTFQLTPEEVTALLGQNNIWADAGDVTVEYRSN